MMRGALALGAAALAAACATPEAPAPHGALALRCDDGVVLHLQSLPDEVYLEGLPGGREVLLRDAGGVTPQQQVFSSARVRAELRLGAQAGEAVVHLLQPEPRELRCRNQ